MRPSSSQSSTQSNEVPGFTEWLKTASPHLKWDVPHLRFVRQKLAAVTRGEIKKLAISWPPQHWKTISTTVHYPIWRMLRTPGVRVAVASYNQNYANDISKWSRAIIDRLGIPYGDSDAVASWNLANGSNYRAVGVGVGISGRPVDCMVIDDPFRHRADADSVTVQDKVYSWYMDDVYPRVQKGGNIIIIHTRWGPGDLIGRILASEDARNWEFIRLPALAETQEERDQVHQRQGLPLGLPDPLGRQPGEVLCEDAFGLTEILDKKLTAGTGFETVYQQNDLTRGGQFFDRSWFEPTVDKIPEGVPVRRMRYFDLASSRHDMACFTSGVLMAKVGNSGDARYYVENVVRGRWSPGERNERILEITKSDNTLPGFERTWFEKPVFDKNGEATRAIMAKLAGFPVRADHVGGTGSKELRAEPLADAARSGLIKCVTGPWVGAFLTEMEGFPKVAFKDQVDSASGCFNRLTKQEKNFVFSVRGA